ncbi:MAG: class I SAM-dependent methyltransferase [bacterium]
MTAEPMGHVCPPSVIKWLNSPLRKLIQNPKKLFGGIIQPGQTVADLGCGGGFFTVELAKMVGESGRVIAVDLQPEMLVYTEKLARKKGVFDRIILHQCQQNDLGLSEPKVDFALALYVLHEVPDRVRFLRQSVGLMKPEARFMLVEPTHHVKPEQLQQILSEAESVGLVQIKPIKFAFSRGMLCRRNGL